MAELAFLKTDLRIRAAYSSDSTLFPYDTQVTTLQIQSRDYSKVFIEINTKSMNKAFGLDEDAKELKQNDELAENTAPMKNELFGTRSVSCIRELWVVKALYLRLKFVNPSVKS